MRQETGERARWRAAYRAARNGDLCTCSIAYPRAWYPALLEAYDDRIWNLHNRLHGKNGFRTFDSLRNPLRRVGGVIAEITGVKYAR